MNKLRAHESKTRVKGIKELYFPDCNCDDLIMRLEQWKQPRTKFSFIPLYFEAFYLSVLQRFQEVSLQIMARYSVEDRGYYLENL